MSGAAPELRSWRVTLQPLTAADTDAAHALWTDVDVRRFLWDDVVIPRERAAEVLAESAAHFAADGFGLWGVRDAAGGLAGFCGLRPTGRGGPELLYGFRRTWWARGLATECARVVLDHAFDILGLPEVVASTDPANEASARLLTRLGMACEGHGELRERPQVCFRQRADDWRGRRVRVRHAAADDEPFLLGLTPRLAEFPRPSWRTADEIARSDHAVILDALRHPGPDALLLGAERPAGRPAGFVLATTQVDYFTQQRHPHVETLAVDAALEGQGVAAALLDAGEAWARDRGDPYITLTVFDANRRARGFYQRRGYLAETVTMRKRLAAPDRPRRPGDPAGLVIRPSTPADADAIWAVMQPVIAAGETYTWPRDMTRDAALAAWHPPGGHTFVAVLDGAVAGTYLLKANQPGLGGHVANCGYMVAESARGRGLGEALCRHSLDAARALGFRAMQFNAVVSTNRTAVALWQRCGFSIVGTVPQAFAHPRHGLVDIHVMHRFL